jgi:hypothetical protein
VDPSRRHSPDRALWSGIGIQTCLAVLAAGALLFFLVIQGQDDGRAAGAPQTSPAFAAFLHVSREDCQQANLAILRLPPPRNWHEGRLYLRRKLTILMVESDRFARRPAPPGHQRAIAKLQALNRRDVRLLNGFIERLRNPGRRALSSVATEFDRAQATLGPPEAALARSLGLGVCVS